METILFILLGMFIGWNLPQPSWAKLVQEKVYNFIWNYMHNKKDKNA